jgi:hypothetical protein
MKVLAKAVQERSPRVQLQRMFLPIYVQPDRVQSAMHLVAIRCRRNGSSGRGRGQQRRRADCNAGCTELRQEIPTCQPAIQKPMLVNTVLFRL